MASAVLLQEGTVAKTVEELKVWQRARQFAVAVFAILERQTFEHERELREQIKDATDSMVSNIAEGFEQSTDRGFARYLYTSKGSTAEVRSRLSLALERRRISREEFARLDGLGDEVARIITGLIKYLVKSDRRDRGLGGTRPRRR
jgi:four helix bundle protein